MTVVSFRWRVFRQLGSDGRGIKIWHWDLALAPYMFRRRMPQPATKSHGTWGSVHKILKAVARGTWSVLIVSPSIFTLRRPFDVSDSRSAVRVLISRHHVVASRLMAVRSLFDFKAFPLSFALPFEGSGAPLPCPPGTASDSFGLTKETDCSPCEPGFYCPGYGAITSTEECLERFYCPGGDQYPTRYEMNSKGCHLMST